MTGFRVGVADPILAARPTAEMFTRGNYLGALANRVDSFWVPDHLNQLFPRSLWKEKYSGGTKLVPRLDACMEPWIMLGHLAARNRVGRMRLGVAVTDTGRRNPAVTAQAAATLHLLTRGRAILGIGPANARATSPTGSTGPSRSRGLKRRWPPSARCGIPVANSSTATRPYFPLRDALFDLPPYRGRWPEMWIAAHGPRMLRAVGTLCGRLLPRLSSPTEGLRAAPGSRSVGCLRRGSRSDDDHPRSFHFRCARSQPRRRR